MVGIVASYIFQLNGALNGLPARGRASTGWRSTGSGASGCALLTVGDRDRLARGRLRHRAVPGAPALAWTTSRSRPRGSTAPAGGSALRYVILPELRGTIEFYVVVASITMLAWVFAYVYTLTEGGPGDRHRPCSSSTSTTRACATRCPGWRRRSRSMLLGATLVVVVLLVVLRSRAAQREELGVSRRLQAGRDVAALRRARSRWRCWRCSTRSVFMLIDGVQDAGRVPRQRRTACPWPLSLRQLRRGRCAAASSSPGSRTASILTVGAVDRRDGVAALAAFAIARMRFRGRERAASRHIALMVVPPVVMLMPLFMLFTNLEPGRARTAASILIYAGPDAAVLDLHADELLPRHPARADRGGAHRRRAHAAHPAAASCCRSPCPALVTLVVVNALWVWNELLIALVFLPERRAQDAHGRRDRVPAASTTSTCP